MIKYEVDNIVFSAGECGVECQIGSEDSIVQDIERKCEKWEDGGTQQNIEESECQWENR